MQVKKFDSVIDIILERMCLRDSQPQNLQKTDIDQQTLQTIVMYDCYVAQSIVI